MGSPHLGAGGVAVRQEEGAAGAVDFVIEVHSVAVEERHGHLFESSLKQH